MENRHLGPIEGEKHLIQAAMDSSRIRNAADFISACATDLAGQYRFYPGGQVSLYASCYAAMGLHYISALEGLSKTEVAAWVDYINSWQDEVTGYFIGPEIVTQELIRPDLNAEYVKLHLLIHVLPALDALGGKPVFSMNFMQPFLKPGYLLDWLEKRDLSNPWYEGNLLLAIGQLLVYLLERENKPEAEPALAIYFDWLDQHQDPRTGLWVAGEEIDPYLGLYGSAHQLLAYHYCGRKVRHAERIIDTVLGLQQDDGSFSQTPGGGACEDVDAVNTLVDLVKRTGYRTSDIQEALNRCLAHIFQQQADEMGFVYRWGQSYLQSGVLRTYTPANRAEIFSTWYRLNTLALLSEVISHPELENIQWKFNSALSMGWHDQAVTVPKSKFAGPEKVSSVSNLANIKQNKQVGRVFFAFLAKAVSPRMVGRFVNSFLRRYFQFVPSETALPSLAATAAVINEIGNHKAQQIGVDLPVEYWGTLVYPFFLKHIEPGSRVLHLGSGDGSFSFTLATHARSLVVAVDSADTAVAAARRQYHHPRLQFRSITDLPSTEFNVLVMTEPDAIVRNWEAYQAWVSDFRSGTILLQASPSPTAWTGLLLPSTASGGRPAQGYENELKALFPGWQQVEFTVEKGIALLKWQK